MAIRLMELAFIIHKVRDVGKIPMKFSLVSITPFGRPVVPLEYNWNATSPVLGSTPGSIAW